MKILLLILALFPLAANAITTTLEYEDQREIAATNSVWQSVVASISSATNSTLALAQASITSATNEVLQTSLREISSATNGLARQSELSAYKPLQTAKSSPDSSGAGIQFIDTITQDANGVITATKKTVRDAAFGIAGIVQLNNSTNSTSTTMAATPAAVRSVAITANDALSAANNALGNSGEQTLNGSLTAMGVGGLVETLNSSAYEVGVRAYNGDNYAVKYLANGIFVSTDGGTIYAKLSLPNVAGTLALTAEIDSATNGLIRVESDPTVADATNALWSATSAAIANIDIPDIPSYSETNTTANIVYHYGCETVAIPANGTLTGSTTNWPQGAQSFIVLNPAGAYTVSFPLEYSGYGTWPTNTALCVAWRYGSKIYVNPIKLLEE